MLNAFGYVTFVRSNLVSTHKLNMFKNTPAKWLRRRQRVGGAFTLVELLVVLAVMVALGGMLTYALAGAQTQARIKRTQADVISISQLIQNRVNEVSLSQLSLVYGRSGLERLRIGDITTPTSFSGPATGNVNDNPRRIAFMAKERARLIIAARRDLARMTLPQCRADLILPPANIQFRTYAAGNWLPNVAKLKPPAQWNRMRVLAGLMSAVDMDGFQTANPVTNPEVDGMEAAYDYSTPAFQAPFSLFAQAYDPPSGSGPIVDTIYDDPSLPSDPNDPNDRFWSRQNESAECLYLILATTELFSQTAIDQISETQIGDTDGDGFLEILDAWGQPYEFIREPIGLRHPAINNYDPSGSNSAEQYPLDPDPFDFLAADVRFDTSTHPTTNPPLSPTAYYPIYLPPVVVSAGRDGQFGQRISYLDTNPATAGPEIGVNEAYCSSAVHHPTSGGGAYQPTYPGIPIARYPDPFFDVTTVSSNVGNRYLFDPTLIVTAKQGGGLGAILNREFSADNISSLDSDF